MSSIETPYPGAAIEAITADMRIEEFNRERDLDKEFVPERSICPMGRAHHWFINGGEMTCIKCEERKPVPTPQPIEWNRKGLYGHSVAFFGSPSVFMSRQKLNKQGNKDKL